VFRGSLRLLEFPSYSETAPRRKEQIGNPSRPY